MLGPAGRRAAGGAAWRWLALSGLLAGLTCPAQVTFKGKLKNFRLPDYYAPASPAQTNQALKTLLSGAEAEQLPGGQVRIAGLRIESFREDGQRDVDVRAEACVLDLTRREAHGPGHLEVSSASGLYAIEGDGFSWRQSDGVLVISNRVRGTLQREVVEGRSAEALLAPPAAPAAAATGQVVRISSDSCVFNKPSNEVVQSGHVLAEDAQVRLSCDQLTVRFSPAKRVEEVLAQGGLSVLNKTDQSQVRAGRAVYAFAPGRETLVLSERPTWQDRSGLQDVTAERFVLNLQERSLRAEQGAVMHLPRDRFKQPALLPAAQALRPPRVPPGDQPGRVEIRSDTMTLLLATTNRPHRRAQAEGGVEVLSPGDDTRASGERLVVDEGTGLILLSGQAQWTAEGRVVRADALAVDPTNKVFTGRGNTFFRLPLQQAGPTGLFAGATNRPGATNVFLEITAREFSFLTNTLSFEGPGVVARFLEKEALRGTLTCGSLAARLGHQLEGLEARGRVMAENYPPPAADGASLTNLLACATLTAVFSDSNRVITLEALGDVQAAQIRVPPAAALPLVTDLNCDRLTARVLAKAGRVDLLQAEGHVRVSQADKKARGQRATYQDETQQVVLQGQPYAEFAQGRVSDAQTLVWDRATGSVRGRGKYRVEWTRPAGETNTLGLPFLKR